MLLSFPDLLTHRLPLWVGTPKAKETQGPLWMFWDVPSVETGGQEPLV
jgi:hypothetical protein